MSEDALGVEPIRHVEGLEAERNRLADALREIHGGFVEGQRNIYLPGDKALDRIREVAREALERRG